MAARLKYCTENKQKDYQKNSHTLLAIWSHLLLNRQRIARENIIIIIESPAYFTEHIF